MPFYSSDVLNPPDAERWQQEDAGVKEEDSADEYSASMSASDGEDVSHQTKRKTRRTRRPRSGPKRWGKPSPRAYDYPCDVCGLKYRSHGELKYHMGKHSGELPYKCRKCNKRFSSEDARDSHDRKSHRQYICENCGYNATCPKALSRHLTTHFKDNQSEMKRDKPICKPQHRPYNYECSVCEAKYRSQGELTYHMGKHTGELPYKCRKCNRRFPTTDERNTHDQKSHIQYICEYCGYNAVKPKALDVHIATHTKVKSEAVVQKKKEKQLPRPYNFFCDVCGVKKKSPGELRYHMAEHTGELPYKCRKCHKRFETEEERDGHDRTSHMQYICEFCGHNAVSPSGLKYHIATHNKEKLDKPARIKTDSHPPRPKQNYICDICGAKYKSRGELKYHIGKHTGELPYKCRKCNRRFPTDDDRHEHDMKSHRQYVCEFCGHDVSSPGALKFHIMSVHTNEKPYRCSLCESRFVKEITLTYHIRNVHTNEKPFQCSFCGKGCKTKVMLTYHERMHTGEKPFSCTFCDKKFIARSNLQSHIRSIHSNEKPFQCRFCSKGFKSRFLVQEHERRHTGEKPFKCSFCEKSFVAKSTLRDHERIHTGEKPFKCKYCNKGFALSNNRNTHEKTHTGEKPHRCEICGAGFLRADFLKKHCVSAHNYPGFPPRM